MKTHFMLISLLAVSLTACRGLRDDPIVDTQGVNMARYETDLAQCRAYAEQVDVGADAARGAVGGAVVGGAIGAIVGNSDTAARGAGVGAVGGGARGAGRGLREKDQVLRRCLIGRGYRVLN